MSEKNTRSDKAQTPPLENPTVTVTPTTRSGVKSDDEHVKTVERSLKSDVHRAIEENKDKGSQKQLDAARKVVEEVAETKVNPAKIEKVKVVVEGEVNGNDVAVPIEKNVPLPKKIDSAGAPIPPPATPAPPTKTSIDKPDTNKTDRRRRG